MKYFRPLEPTPNSLLHRIGIVFGTSELHAARDHHSFTEMMDNVLRKNALSLPFTELSRYKLKIDKQIHKIWFNSKVNESWSQRKIKQKSKTDVVEVGDNWKKFYWPSKHPMHQMQPKRGSKGYLLKMTFDKFQIIRWINLYMSQRGFCTKKGKQRGWDFHFRL